MKKAQIIGWVNVYGKSVPLVQGRPIDNWRALVYCPFCGGEHIHSQHDGPRIAHCPPVEGKNRPEYCLHISGDQVELGPEWQNMPGIIAAALEEDSA